MRMVSLLHGGDLAERLAQVLQLPRLDVERHRFSGGEQYRRFSIEDRMELFGQDIVFVGGTETDDDLHELYRLGCAAAQFGTRRRIFVIPFFGYSTMERGVQPGEIVTAKTVTRMLSSIPNTGIGNIFLFADLHVSGLLHYFEGDCLRYELYAEPFLRQAVTELGLVDFVFGSADLGRPQWVKSYARHFGVPIVVIDKDREMESTKVFSVIGDVAGKAVVIYDDMTRTAGTLINAAEAYLAAGAREVYAVISHLALADQAVARRLEDSPINRIITTNSHSAAGWQATANASKFTIVDISPIFADAIRRLIGPEEPSCA